MYVLHNVNPATVQSVTWDGQGKNGAATGGEYSAYIRATDAYGNSSLGSWRGLTVQYKKIVVSLSQQRLWAYDGTHIFLTSLVTTGNQALPTPVGTFHILIKFHPFTFHSPWPKSSPYYYAPSKVEYAMMFQSGGYYIHDAPWRSVFGPGSNAQLGTPGTNYTGTHGCVNVPPNVAQALYGWASDGTVVIVEK
jgi:lipoprotein-anchoring transpeptidase ErfK/SrfK